MKLYNLAYVTILLSRKLITRIDLSWISDFYLKFFSLLFTVVIFTSVTSCECSSSPQYYYRETEFINNSDSSLCKYVSNKCEKLTLGTIKNKIGKQFDFYCHGGSWAPWSAGYCMKTFEARDQNEKNTTLLGHVRITYHFYGEEKMCLEERENQRIEFGTVPCEPVGLSLKYLIPQFEQLPK